MIFIDSKNISQYKKLAFTKSEKIFLFIDESIDESIEIELNEREIEVEILGIILLDQDQKVKLNTKSVHVSPNSYSRTHIKGVFSDSSVFDFKGMIDIKHNALLSDAYLQNDNLIIGENAIVNSSPQLEICADDVKASHGVTISTYDEEYKYYLNSRGISNLDAQKLMVYGFVNDIISKNDNSKDLINRVMKKIDNAKL